MSTTGVQTNTMQPRVMWTSLFSFTTSRHAPALISALVFALAAGLILPSFSIVLGDLFDVFASPSPGDLLAKVTKCCLRLVVLGSVGWLLSSCYFALFTAFGELQAANARNILFLQLFKRDVQWFHTQHDGTGAFLSDIKA